MLFFTAGIRILFSALITFLFSLGEPVYFLYVASNANSFLQENFLPREYNSNDSDEQNPVRNLVRTQCQSPALNRIRTFDLCWLSFFYRLHCNRSSCFCRFSTLFRQPWTVFSNMFSMQSVSLDNLDELSESISTFPTQILNKYGLNLRIPTPFRCRDSLICVISHNQLLLFREEGVL